MTIRRTKGSVVYPRVEKALKKLGEEISLARRARRISTVDFAAQMGVSRATLSRLEAGDPGCSLNTLAMACMMLGSLDKLSNLLQQNQDEMALHLMTRNLPKRFKTKKNIEHSKALSNNDNEDEETW